MSEMEHLALTVRCERLYRLYAAAVDGGDLEALRGLCIDDVRLTRGRDATLEGIESLLAVYRAHVGPSRPLTRHLVSNVVVDPVEGGVSARAYFQAWFYEDQATRVVSGSYDDVLVEVDGELRFAHKVNNVERVVVLPPAVTP